jgi:AcrR family transcriptional regulator
MKTKDRILLASLQLFNEHGEPNVTTLQIADELNISPGNLYYHFKNKTEIIDDLFTQYDAQISELLDIPEGEHNIEDQWLFLHLLFELIAQYRFIYQDLVNVLGRYDRIQPKFKRILNKKLLATCNICKSLAQQGVLQINQDEMDALCQNIVLTITYWISYDTVKNVINGAALDLGRGAYQVIAMIAPFLRDEERQVLMEMGKAYIT